jgi:hypothetical protein
MEQLRREMSLGSQLPHAARRPGIVQRVTWWGLGHLSVVMGLSLVGWLLALALAALLLLPGCSDPGVEQRERQAFDTTHRFIVHEAEMLQAGHVTPEQFVSDVRAVLDALREGEAGERANAGAGWEEILGAALGSSTVVGGLLHLRRNVTRKRDLADLTAELEAKLRGGAA